ncbi:MAG TPA: cyclase [Chloroflexia bacterium]|nr:cyclase [Chloroflexia bacterium]
MPWIHIRYRVTDYNTWKQVYDQTAALKRGQGWKRYRIFQVAGDRNDLLVMEEFASLEQARTFLQSDDLKNAIRQAGVLGTPEILLLEGLEEGLP